MESILADISRFTPITFEGEYDDLKYILEKEQEINRFLNKLVDNGVITPVDQKKMCPNGCAPGFLYGSCKVDKVVPVCDIPPLRTVLSAIDTLSYTLAKYLVPVLSPLTFTQIHKQLRTHPNGNNICLFFQHNYWTYTFIDFCLPNSVET